MEHRKKCVVVCRTSSTARAPVYKHVRRSLGLKLVVVHPVVVSEFADCFDDWILEDTLDVARLENAIRNYIETKNDGVPLDAVISLDEYGIYPAACVAEALNLRPIPLPSEAVKDANSKTDFRALCKRHNIQSPMSVLIRWETDDVRNILETEQMSFPAVVKTSPGAGSMLTKKCENLSETVAYVAEVWKQLPHLELTRVYRAIGRVMVLVEEFIGGQEVDIDCVIDNGKIVFACVSDNFPSPPPFFCEQGGLCPSGLHAKEQEALMSLLRRYVDVYDTEMKGVLHFEAKYDHSREAAYVVEANLRPGSAETETMLQTVYDGFSIGECTFRCALNIPLSNLPLLKPVCWAASVNVYPEREGILKALNPPKEDSFLVKWAPSAKVGDFVSPPPKLFRLSAFAVVRGRTRQLAVAHLKDFVLGIQLQVEDP